MYVMNRTSNDYMEGLNNLLAMLCPCFDYKNEN
jgi:hypothetical protein